MVIEASRDAIVLIEDDRIDICRDLTERVRPGHELSHRATHDYLTGLNRQQFGVLLDREIRRVRRSGSPLSLIMFDVDRFKIVNDNLGHEAGDEVPKLLSRELARGIRASDNLARWGGEEFILMLPECGAVDAGRMAEQLRRRVLELDFGAAIDHLIVSLGVACHHPEQSARELLRRIDDALYTAKQEGRNRVVVARRGRSPRTPDEPTGGPQRTPSRSALD